MEIKVRGLSPVVVRNIDSSAKSKQRSRNQYLQEQLNSLSYLDEYKELNETLQETFRELRVELEQAYNQMDAMEKGYHKLFALISLVTEVDLDYVDQFIEERK